jgi:hypothetical protein
MATIKGKWRWNDNVRDPWYHHEEKNATIAFKSGEKSFLSITVVASFLNHAIIHYDEIEVQSCELIWEDGVLIDCIDTFDENYRLMDFGENEQEIDDELYNFIIANAHKWDISSKLEIIAENQQKVYEKGYSVGNDAGYDEGLEIGHENGYNQGVEDGRQAEYDAFWDAKQPYKNNPVSMTGEYGGSWSVETFKPKYDMVPTYSQYMFYCNNLNIDLVEYLNSIGRKLDFSQCKNMNYTFAGAAFTHIGSVCGNGVGVSNVFASCAKLVTIDEFGNCKGGDIDASTTNTFYGCTALENITVKGKFTGDVYFHWSKNLSKASIISIINALSDNVSGKKLQLSETAIKSAFGVEPIDWDGDGKKEGWIGNGVEEWMALISTKSNWTITALDV